jgi:hypothetical protein
VNDHFRILQQRIEAVAVHAGERLKHAAGVDRGKRLERALNEIVQDKKKRLDAGEHNPYIRHQLAIFVAIGNQHRKHVNRKQEAPEEQRTFLAGPERGDFIEGGKIAIAVRDDVRLGEIIGEEEILKTECGEDNQNSGGHAGLAGALHQQRVAGNDRRDAAD